MWKLGANDVSQQALAFNAHLIPKRERYVLIFSKDQVGKLTWSELK